MPRVAIEAHNLVQNWTIHPLALGRNNLVNVGCEQEGLVCPFPHWERAWQFTGGRWGRGRWCTDHRPAICIVYINAIARP